LENEIKELEKHHDIFNKHRKILVSGTAGCGKSTFLKSLLVNQVNDRLTRIPFFIELRRISNKGSITAQIAKDLENITAIAITENIVKKCIKEGRFTLILDGFDEVPEEFRENVYEQIEELCFKYPDLQVIASSRPEHSIQNLVAFSAAEILPLRKDEACDLIARVPFNEKIKASFLESLRSDLYDKHKTFASNPLLLSTMLLTYCETGEIPDNLSLFFENAFSALYYRHDLTKDFFRRNIKSPLASDEFKELFSYFSASTFFKHGVEFQDHNAIDAIRAGQKHIDKNFEPQFFLTDILENVCLLVRDGLVLTFTHRTFQEYFAAKFLSRCSPEERSAAYPTIIQHSVSEQVATFLYNISPREVESELIEPELKRIVAHSEPKTDREILEFAESIFGRVQIKYINHTKGKEKNTEGPTHSFTLDIGGDNKFIFGLIHRSSEWFAKSHKNKVKKINRRLCMDKLTTYLTAETFDSFGFDIRPTEASDENLQLFREIELFEFYKQIYTTSSKILEIIKEKKKDKKDRLLDMFS
ncbi:NACHT domain-containing protein, partial [Marinobacter sp. DUT-1]|uniref:NACHT domain-containing protein n=1 Tax=Marinobacter sp. DUT-1 TaxID=3412037 RepID=UPI003D183CCC